MEYYGSSSFLMGKSTISMAIFNSFLYVYQRVGYHKRYKHWSYVTKLGSHTATSAVPISMWWPMIGFDVDMG